MKKTVKNFLKKMDIGNIVDQLGSMLIMMFCFALIFAMSAYGKMVEMKLDINNICKTYLYQMEQDGCLTTTNQASMLNELANIGVMIDGDTLKDTTNLGDGADNQAAYGDKMKLVCHAKFTNPLYQLLGKETKPQNDNLYFVVPGLSPTLSYTVELSATAKW